MPGIGSSGPLTMEWAGSTLVVRAADAAPGLVALAARLPYEPFTLTVVVEPSAASSLSALNGEALEQLAAHISTSTQGKTSSIRLVAADFGRASVHGGSSPAAQLAEKLGSRVVAPDGNVIVLRGGELFSAGTGWWTYQEGQAPEWSGPRFPVPAWQAVLSPETWPPVTPILGEVNHRYGRKLSNRMVVTSTPAGLWVRCGSIDDMPLSNAGFGVPVLEHNPIVLVGAPGEVPPAAAELAMVFESLPISWRESVVAAPYGLKSNAWANLVQELADNLGWAVRSYEALPYYSASGVPQLATSGVPGDAGGLVDLLRIDLASSSETDPDPFDSDSIDLSFLDFAWNDPDEIGGKEEAQQPAGPGPKRPDAVGMPRDISSAEGIHAQGSAAPAVRTAGYLTKTALQGSHIERSAAPVRAAPIALIGLAAQSATALPPISVRGVSARTTTTVLSPVSTGKITELGQGLPPSKLKARLRQLDDSPAEVELPAQPDVSPNADLEASGSVNLAAVDRNLLEQDTAEQVRVASHGSARGGSAGLLWLADRVSTPQERQEFRVSLGWRYDAAARAVARVLAEFPGLRAAGGVNEAMVTELAAVRVFAGIDQGEFIASMRSGGNARDRAFATCIAGGLRRLPTLEGVVIRGGPVPPGAIDAYRPGNELTEMAPMIALDDLDAYLPGGAEVLIWSVTGRRLAGLVEGPRAATQVVFLPGTAFKVVAINSESAANARPVRQVLLEEVVPARLRSAAPDLAGRVRAKLVNAAELRAKMLISAPAVADDPGRLAALPGDPTWATESDGRQVASL